MIKRIEQRVNSFIKQGLKKKKVGYYVRYHPTLRYTDFPSQVIVWILNVCNSSCIHCGIRELRERPDFEPRFIEFVLYKKIVDEVAKYPRTLFRPFTGGEPLLHPKYVDMIRYAKDVGIKCIGMNTNGILFSKKRAVELIEAGIDEVEFSLDAFTEETYLKVRRNHNFKKIIKNVHNFIDIVKGNDRKINIGVSMVEMKDTENEIEDFKKYWTNLVDRVWVRRFHSCNGMVKDRKSERHKKMLVDTERYPCPQLWERMTVREDGKVIFCCNDLSDYSLVGDIADNSINNIWVDKDYNQLRDIHMHRKFDKIPICKKCGEVGDWMS